MARDTATGERITLHFDADRCVHSRNCVLGNPRVFVPNADGAWLHPDAADANEVEAIVRSCPSGALTFTRSDTAGERAPEVNTMRVREGGPLAFNAEATVAGAPQPYRMTLCRCGLSRRKPFCDNSHQAAGFDATGEPAGKPSDPLARRNGPLVVSPQKDGPLKVAGNLEVVSGTGRTLNRVEEAFFCRCGHSKDKPYCDGSHRKAGFEADGD